MQRDISFPTLAMAIYAATLLILNECDFKFERTNRGVFITLHVADVVILDENSVTYTVCEPS